MWTYRATVLRHLDGDSLVARIDLGFRLWSEQHLRLNGLDAPELRSRDPEQRRDALAAQYRLAGLVPVGATCTIRTDPDPRDKYGRWLCQITTDDGKDVNAVLLSEGLARAYDGGARG